MIRCFWRMTGEAARERPSARSGPRGGELRALGCEGWLCRGSPLTPGLGARSTPSETASAYVPAVRFAPGEAYQYDWSHEIVVMDGVTTTVKVAHVGLLPSPHDAGARPIRRVSAGDECSTPTSGRLHFFRGACSRGIYDNMKTAVETILIGKNWQYNRRFLQMCSHHLVEPVRRARRASGC